MQDSDRRFGVFCALGAYSLWGGLPVYLKAVSAAPADEILMHRVIWSLLFTGLLIALAGRFDRVRATLRNSRHVLTLVASSSVIAFNWLLYIWAVNNGQLLEGSLGYYINPLVNVLFGLVLLRERLAPLQWVAVGLAAAGIAVELVAIGRVPVIALALAVSFSLYGLLRKRLPVDPQTGLMLETALLTGPAILWWLVWADSATSDLSANSASFNLLLIAAGPVTAIPLMLFAAAAQRLNYSTLGMFQYLAPSCMFLLAVFVFDEALLPHKLLTFGFIWTALLIFSAHGILQHRRQRRVQAADA